MDEFFIRFYGDILIFNGGKSMTTGLKRLSPRSLVQSHDDFLWPFENRMNQLINNFFKEDSKNSVFATSGNFPMMNAVEKDGHYKLIFAVSGMTADDVDVQIKDNMLTVKGRMAEEYRSHGDDMPYRELRQSAFSRMIQLPDKLRDVDPEALVKDGMLILDWELPDHEKVIEDQSKKICVKNG